MNLKNGISSIVFWFLALVCFLAIIFVISGLNAKPTNWTIVGIGAIILAPFVIYLMYSKIKLSAELKGMNSKYKAQMLEFKKTADCIPFDLGKAIVQKRNRYETRTVVEGKGAALNYISGNELHNEEIIEHTYCKVLFKVNYHGKRLTFEEVIHKDETSLQMHFYMQKETAIYINPNNPEHYYIDLEFLEDA